MTDTKADARYKGCGRKELDDFVAPMCINGEYENVCPLCALKIRNETHGMGTQPFEGSVATEMFTEAYWIARDAGIATDFERTVAERMGI